MYSFPSNTITILFYRGKINTGRGELQKLSKKNNEETFCNFFNRKYRKTVSLLESQDV